MAKLIAAQSEFQRLFYQSATECDEGRQGIILDPPSDGLRYVRKWKSAEEAKAFPRQTARKGYIKLEICRRQYRDGIPLPGRPANADGFCRSVAEWSYAQQL